MITTMIIPSQRYETKGKIRIEADTEKIGCSITFDDDCSSSKRFNGVNMLEASQICRAFQIIFGPKVLELSNLNELHETEK